MATKSTTSKAKRPVRKSLDAEEAAIAAQPKSSLPLQAQHMGKVPSGKRHAGRTFLVDKIETPKRLKSPSKQRVNITLSNMPNETGRYETEILVDFENNAPFPEDGSEKLKFQFVAKNYKDVFSKLHKCIDDWMRKGAHDPLQ